VKKNRETLPNQSRTAQNPIPNAMPDKSVKYSLYDQMRILELELQKQEYENLKILSLSANNAFEYFFNACPIASLIINPLGLIEKANPAAEKLLLSNFKKLENNKFEQFINAEDKKDYEQFIQEILSLQKAELDLVLRLNLAKDFVRDNDFQDLNDDEFETESCLSTDEFIYVECHGYVIRDNNQQTKIVLALLEVTKHVLSYADLGYEDKPLADISDESALSIFQYNKELIKSIAELKSYKRQIIEQEALLETIFNSSSDGIVIFDFKGKIISVNPATENIFGYQKEELMQLDLDAIIPAKNNKFLENIITNSSIKPINSEGIGKHKDGYILPLYLSITKFFRNEIIFSIIIVRDLTEQKRWDKREQEHLDELTHIARLNLVGEIVSEMAHEVNQPLTAIANYSQTCLNIINNDVHNKDKLIEVLNKSHAQVLKAGQIIHRMRDLINSKKLQGNNADINKLINDAICLCGSALKQNSVMIKLELKEKLPSLQIDSIQIEQVLINIIRNSLDALTSSPRTTPKKLSIQTKKKNEDYLEIRIKDNGPGIEKDVQEKIFTPFYTSKENGMGLGLSICRSILDAHSGILYFNSLPGKGTTFYLSLPINKNKSQSFKFY